MTTDPETLLRLGALEAKVDHIYRHLTGQEPGLPTTIPPMAEGASGVSDRVRALVREGNAIEAIKVQRDETGQSLVEAKAAVDALG